MGASGDPIMRGDATCSTRSVPSAANAVAAPRPRDAALITADEAVPTIKLRRLDEGPARGLNEDVFFMRLQ